MRTAKAGAKPGFASVGLIRTFPPKTSLPMRFCLRPDAKARALAPVLLTLLSVTPEMPASAQVVYCTNCSSELTQLQNYLQLVATLAKQAALLEQSITQTGLMVKNATPLAKPSYGIGQADLLAL